MTTRIKILLILAISAVLLQLQVQTGPPKPYTYKKIPMEIFKRQQLLRFDFQQRELANLAVAYSSGVRSGLTKKIRDIHQRLHLQHLFTPSGLHYTALLLFLSPLLFWVPKRPSGWMFIIPLLFFCLPWLLEGFFSIKRISALKVAHILCQRFGVSLSSYQLFLMVFFVDFFIGTYRESPASFSYSFLFLGLIFSTYKESKIVLIISLLLGQLLVGFINQAEIYPLGFIMGFMATSVFTLIFPVVLAGFLIAPLGPIKWVEPLLDLYLKFLETLALISSHLENSFYPSTISLIGVCLFLVFYKKRFLLFFVFNITPLTNTHPSHYWAPTHYKEIESTKAIDLKVSYQGWSYINQKQHRCLAKYYEKMGWREFCRER